MSDRDANDPSVMAERQRDDTASVLLCALLAVAATIVWSMGLTMRDDAARFAAAPTCATAQPTDSCRVVAEATVVDRFSDGLGRSHLTLDNNAVVILDANTPEAWVPHGGSKIETVTWRGGIAQIGTDAGRVVDTSISPNVGLTSNTVLIALALGSMCVLALVALGPRLITVLSTRFSRGRRAASPGAAKVRAAVDVAAQEAEEMPAAAEGSFALQSKIMAAQPTAQPKGMSAVAAAPQGMQLNPIRSSSGASVVTPASAMAPAPAPAAAPTPAAEIVAPTPVYNANEGPLSFDTFSVPSHPVTAAAFAAPAPAQPAGRSLNPVGAPVPQAVVPPAGLSLNPVGAPVPQTAVPPAGLSLNPVGAPVPQPLPSHSPNPVATPTPPAARPTGAPPAAVQPGVAPAANGAAIPVAGIASNQAPGHPPIPPAQPPTPEEPVAGGGSPSSDQVA